MRNPRVHPREEPESKNKPAGFDAPIVRLEDDHLNRWPLAREVYSVAVNGPPEWSVRVSVYGEWGTGKTTVLRFVDSLARSEDNIVVWFDPWEHETKASLWRAFILQVYHAVEEKFGGITSAGNARAKDLISRFTNFAKRAKPALATANQQVADVIDVGLGFLKDFFNFGPKDLASLKEVLGSKRIVVLIDDLDRTAAELVPEILYALKQVMDIPGFSFVCAFDPVVVGKVLRVRHRGFGDGLKFLEKIIDYPVWLPPVTKEGLLRMALADRRDHCPFIPESEIRNALPLLPGNPRAIRQFIRLLALLKKQTARHYDSELRWSVILPATVIRTRFPQLADSLLTDLSFLLGIGMRNSKDRHSEEGQKVDAEISKHIESAAEFANISLADTDKKPLLECMRRICDQLNLWLGTSVEEITYLASIAERPCVVTLKEFEEFLVHWKSAQNVNYLAEWIATHARGQHQTECDVARELTKRTIDRYTEKLREADFAFHRKASIPHRTEATNQFLLLKALLQQASSVIPTLHSQEWMPLKLIFEELPKLGDAAGSAHKHLWPRTRSLVIEMVRNWGADIRTLLSVIKPFGGSLLARVDGREQRKVIREVSEILVRRIATSLPPRFNEPSWIESIRGGDWDSRALGKLILNANGPLWKGERKVMLRILRNAKSQRAVQENAYALLEWIDSTLRHDSVLGDLNAVKDFVRCAEVFSAIWRAAMAVPFAGRYVYQIRKLPKQLESLGILVDLPSWWDAGLAEVTFPKDEQDETEP